MLCKLKKNCPFPHEEVHPCWRSDCDNFMHVGCTNLLFDRHSVNAEDRPTDEDYINGIPIAFCTLTCHKKWLANKKKEKKALEKELGPTVKKRKAPWEDDGSLNALLDWITTEGNYAHHCGSKGNQGKSKSAHHKEIALFIQRKVPDTERNAKDAENKIVKLERQFRDAVDWSNNTGQGAENPGDFEAAVLKRCPQFKELEPVMLDRPNAKPLASNESSDEDSDDEEGEGGQESAVNLSANENDTFKTPARSKENEEPSGGISSGGSGSGTSSSKKRLTTSNGGPRKKKLTADEVISAHLGVDDDNKGETCQQLRVREIEAREKEANARMVEAKANAAKAEKEADILGIDKTVKILQARKALLDEGTCSEEALDKHLPLPTPVSSTVVSSAADSTNK